MARVRPLKQTLSGGEISRLLDGQSNFAKYLTGCRIMENMLPVPQGPAIRRGGTQFVAEVKDSQKPPFLIPFERDEIQTYQIEAGDRYLRFFDNTPARIEVPTTDAVITNGDFQADLTGWTDHSIAPGVLKHEFLGERIVGVTGPAVSNFRIGEGYAASNKHYAFRFTAPYDGAVLEFKMTTGLWTASGQIVGKVYTDNAGSPGVQIGGDSPAVTIGAAETTYTFGWASGHPTFSAGDRIWCVFANIDTTLDVRVKTTSDLGPDFATGSAGTITAISDGSGGFPLSWDHMGPIAIGRSPLIGVMTLDASAGGRAWAEQAVTTTNLGQEHVLQFKTLGDLGGHLHVRIGSESQGVGFVNDAKRGLGCHVIAFTPTVSPFYVQFWNDRPIPISVDEVKLLSNAPLECGTPYEQADLYDSHGHARTKIAQFRDFVYLFHPDYPTTKILHYGRRSWSIETVDFIDGPYLDENTTATTLTPSGTTGAITITASAVEGINNDIGFQESDIGRLVRIKHGAWGAARITAITDSLIVSARVQGGVALSGTAAVSAWRLGAWSGTTGYPAAGTVNESRLFAAGGLKATPHRYDASQSFFFERFSPSAPDGSVGDGDAISRTLGAEKVQQIFWLRQVKDLIAGTLGAPFRIFSSELNAELTPSNTNSKRTINQGNLDLDPIVAGNNAILYAARQGRRLMELAFRFDADGYRSPDMTALAPHIFPKKGKLLSMGYAQQPESVVWTTNQMGQLASFSYERDQEITAWGRHPLGGSGKAEYCAVIPGPDDDQVWSTVRRTINGATKRYVEMMQQPLEDNDPIEASFYVDSGLSLKNTGALLAGESCTLTLGAVTGTGITATAGAAVFEAGHVGREIRHIWVSRYQNDDPQLPLFTRSRGTIASYVSPTEITLDITVDFPSVGPIAAADWLLSVPSVAGLDHAEGETVAILGDGVVLDPQTVSAGGVGFFLGGQAVQASWIHIGFHDTNHARLVPTRVDAGVAAGTALVELKRIGKIFVGVHRSAVFKMGSSMAKLNPIKYAKQGVTPEGDPEPLTNEIVKGPSSGGWQREADIYFVQDKPLPLVLQIAVPSQLLSSDAGGP